MSNIRTIVLPLDGSPVAARAVPVVAEVARRFGADVILLTCASLDEGATGVDFDEATEALAGIEVQRLVFDNRGAAEAMIDVTLAAKGRLLCMSTHGRGGIRRSVLGSVASEVLRSGSVPVLLVGPGSDTDHPFELPGPVMLCIDGSARSERVAKAGADWAKTLGRDVDMVTITNPFDPISPDELQKIFYGLSEHLAKEGLTSEGRAVLASVVAPALADEADALHSPLLVIAPASHSRWQRLLVGSVTLSLLGSAPCPVLVIPELAPSAAGG